MAGGGGCKGNDEIGLIYDFQMLAGMKDGLIASQWSFFSFFTESWWQTVEFLNFPSAILKSTTTKSLRLRFTYVDCKRERYKTVFGDTLSGQCQSCFWSGELTRPVGRGVHGVRTSPPPPKSQKGPPDGIVKDLKWYKTNVVVVGLTN